MQAKTLSEAELSKGDLWVFGYGSLEVACRASSSSADPGTADRRASRALCVYSFMCTGERRRSPASSGSTAAAPPGRTTRSTGRGEASRFDRVAYLRAREQVTSVYREVMRSVWLEDRPAATRQHARLWSTAAMCNMPGGYGSGATSGMLCNRGTANRARTANTVSAVRAIRGEGLPQSPVRRLRIDAA